MIRVIAWKEYREQRVIWVAVALLTALVIGCVAAANPQGLAAGDPDIVLALTLTAIGLAATYGLVCGAMLLAGEREGSTMAFLDSLPAHRGQVWGAKLLAGMSLALLQGLVLAGAAVSFGLPLPAGNVHQGAILSHWNWFWILPAAAVEGCAWGLLGSALSRNVLAAVLGGALLSMPVWCVAIVPLGVGAPFLLGVVCVRAGLALGALGASLLLFARGDMERVQAPPRKLVDEDEEEFEAEPALPRPRRAHGLSAAQSLFWLAWRQGRVGMITLGFAAFLLGLVLPSQGPIFWPVTTLLAGIFCGAAVYLGEQGGGYHRFLGDQRLPPGQVWGLKTLLWFGVSFAACLLVLLGGWQHLVGASMRTGHLEPSEPWQTAGLVLRRNNLLVPLGMWLLYGFSVGETCALAWRKSVAALFMALVFGPALAAVWLPSVVAGDLPAWQVFAVPALLLALNRLLYWPWVSDRLYTARPLALLTVGVLAALAWVGACLGYRVVGLPDVGQPFDVPAFVASLPAPEHNPAGQAIRQAVAQMHDQEAVATQPVQPVAPPPAAPAGAGGMPQPGEAIAGMAAAPAGEPVEPTGTDQQLQEVLRGGWKAALPKLGKWLDVVFRGDWAKELRQGVAQPLGVIEDPRRTTRFMSVPSIGRCERAADLFTTRALQLQARGDDAAALEHLAVVLALSRQMRHQAPVRLWESGAGVERTALAGLDRWLERVGPRPDLLRRALAELDRHERDTPPAAEAVQADYVGTMTSIDDPDLLVRTYGLDDRTPAGRTTAALVAAAWQTPWERARLERLLHILYAGWLRGTQASFAALVEEQQRLVEQGALPPMVHRLGGWLPAGGPSPDGLTQQRLGELVGESWLRDILPNLEALCRNQTLGRCDVRGHRLVLALALYQAEKGKPAPDLEALVREGYLTELPRDPFSGGPFRYRISGGEEIEWDRLATNPAHVRRKVPAGTGIVWSVGPDLRDDGGTAQGLDGPTHQLSWPGPGPFDLIFLVPRR